MTTVAARLSSLLASFKERAKPKVEGPGEIRVEAVAEAEVAPRAPLRPTLALNAHEIQEKDLMAMLRSSLYDRAAA